MVAVSHDNTEADVMRRMIEPDEEAIDPVHARFILALTFKPTDHERVNELSYKA